MSVELIDDGRIAGEKARNADVDAAAAIKPLKIEKNPILIPMNVSQATQDSASLSASNNFLGWAFADAASHYLIFTLKAPMGEVTPGERGYLRIFWTTSASSGNCRWVVEIKPIIDGFTTLTAALTRSVITPAASANAIIESVIEFPPAIFSNGQLIGCKITRDGTNTLDTIAATAILRGVYLSINGRC